MKKTATARPWSVDLALLVAVALPERRALEFHRAYQRGDLAAARRIIKAELVEVANGRDVVAARQAVKMLARCGGE
jgi:arginase family enzyme